MKTSTRAIYLVALMALVVLSMFFRGPGESLDEAGALRAIAPDIEFSAKGGSPPHYSAEGGAVAFSTFDVEPSIRGYAGPIKLMVTLSPEGVITGLSVMHHSETLNYVHAMLSPSYLGQFVGRNVWAPLEPDVDIDAISRATVSVDALARTVRESSRRVAVETFGLSGPGVSATARSKSHSWMIYLALLVAVYSYYRFSPSQTVRMRRDVLAAVLVICGVWLSSYLSVLHVFQMGLYGLPDSMLIWVIIIGAAATLAVSGRFYCGWMCPFGALSELIASLTRLKWEPSPGEPRWRHLKYLVLLLLVPVVFMTGRTDLGTVEPYIVLFSLIGSAVAWALVVLALAANLRIARMWCRFLCPLGALMALLSRQDGRFKSYPACPMGNPPSPSTSECIRCNMCLRQGSGPEKPLQ